jgi:preprotein translocase subunit YajC
MIVNTLLLQAQGGDGLAQYGNLILIGGIVVIFYFFMIRPQQKKQKDQKKFIESIKKGDEVVTVGGLHGKVSAISESTVTLDVDRGAKLTFEKTSISLDASKPKK